MASGGQGGSGGSAPIQAPVNPLQGGNLAFDHSRRREGPVGGGGGGNERGSQVSDFLNQEAFDPRRLHPFANLDKGIDYLVLDEEKTSDLPGGRTPLPSRGWSDDLCYGTGTTYLGGLALGGVWGISEALRRPLVSSSASPTAPGALGGTLGKTPVSPSMRLRINGILNGMTRRGPFVGNSAAVIAMTYNIVNSTLDYYRGRHDTLNSVFAGAISGAIFKSTKGLRPTLVGAGMVASAAAVWSAFKAAYM